MANDGVVFALVFLQEFLGAGESHLVDVALHFISVHADAVVADGEGFGVAIDLDADQSLGAFAAVTSHGRHPALADRIGAVADQLTQKHLVAAVNGLFDDREDVFGMDLDLALLKHRHAPSELGSTTLGTGG